MEERNAFWYAELFECALNLDLLEHFYIFNDYRTRNKKS